MGHIFISYSRRDTEYAHRLADDLQGRGFDAWIDARIDYGSQWPHELQKQLDSCDAFILVMSPSSFASEWVQSELHGDEPWLSVESTQYYDVRGGSRHDDERIVSTSNRGWNQLEYFYNIDFGFRCAMDGRP